MRSLTLVPARPRSFLSATVERLTGELMPLFGATELIRIGPAATGLLLAGALLVGLTGARISLKGLARA